MARKPPSRARRSTLFVSQPRRKLRRNPSPQLSELQESGRRAGSIGGDAVAVTLNSPAPTASRPRAFGHRGEERRGNVATVATGTISTNEEALLDIQHRERWPKFLKPAVELERRSLGAAFS